MSVFAGFWVDGAVRKPEQRHGGGLKAVVAKSKDGSDIGSYLTASLSVPWDSVYWLDTSPRESLTPEELLSLLKVIWPKTEVVNNPEGGAVVEWQVPYDAMENQTPISWGGLTQYPPDLDWVRVTKDNVSQHIFRDCRWRHSSGNWRPGQILGWDPHTGKCIVYHDNFPDFCDCVEASAKGSE